MKQLTYLVPSLGSFILFATTASAQINPSYVNGSANSIIGFINTQLIPLIFGIAIVVFLWGMIKTFLLGSDNDEKRKEGKNLMLWGILALVFMSALWGIVALVTQFFGISPANSAPSVPLIPLPHLSR